MVPVAYTLRYKKDTYTIAEVKAKLEEQRIKTESGSLQKHLDEPKNNIPPVKKDYKAMLSGATVPEIPTIFAHIPADSMVLYVRNPANLLDILNQKSNTTQRLS
jgi:hypothetical protein